MTTIALDRRNNASAVALVGIYEISKILASAVNLQGALRAVLNLMSSYLDLRRGVVGIVDHDGNLDIVAAVCAVSHPSAGGVVPLPEEVASRILAGEMPFVTESVAEHPLLANFVGLSGALDDERVSFLGVPIKTVGRPFGVLGAARVWTDASDVSLGDDVRFLTMVANLIAQTVKLHRRGALERPAGSVADNAATPRRRSIRLNSAPQTISLENIIGISKPMQEVFAQVHLVAPTRSTVIVRGESGTGKELIAKAIHQLSPRHDGPFVTVNCAALPDSLLESELFGHEKGAFTGATTERKGRFELADGGTLFLDEIGEVSTAFQAKLLRVLQEREFERVGGIRTLKVNVRLVCATNRNLEDMVAKGDFRADLYYRINVVPIFMPSLRERRDDIPLLADHFLAAFNEENGRTLRFAPDAFKRLGRCSFPGNVRELENCVQRVATMTKGDLIDELDMLCETSHCACPSLAPQQTFVPAPRPYAATPIPVAPPAAAPMAPPPDMSFPPPPPSADENAFADHDPTWLDQDSLSDTNALPQRDRLIRVMEKAGWVQAKAARMLGMTPRQVGYALRKHNIEIKRI